MAKPKTFQWPDFTQNFIRIFNNQWFLVIVVWIYATLAELILFYVRLILASLSLIAEEPVKARRISKDREERIGRVFELIDQLTKLTDIGAYISNRLAFALLINNLSNLMSMLTLTYHAIENGTERLFVETLHDITDVVDSFIRYFLISHMADRLKATVNFCATFLQPQLSLLFYRHLKPSFRCAP